MAKRINHLLACLAGCVLGSLFGLLVLLKLDAPIFAVLPAGVFPAVGCWMSGITDKKQLAKIAAYAAVGWALTFVLQPSIAQSASSHARRILALPLVGYDWHIVASLVSTLLALIGAYFVPINSDPENQNHVGTSP